MLLRKCDLYVIRMSSVSCQGARCPFPTNIACNSTERDMKTITTWATLVSGYAALSLSLAAIADTGIPTYTYDVSGSSTDMFFTVSGPNYNTVYWNTLTGSTDYPYLLDGPAGGSTTRRFQNFPGSVMGDSGYATSLTSTNALGSTSAGYNNNLAPDAPPHAFDTTVSMFTTGAGQYAGITGGTYTPTPRVAFFNQGTDSQGNPFTDFSSGTVSGGFNGYMSIPVSNGPPPPGRAYSLTQTYNISGTEYGSFSDQAIAPPPAFQRTYQANFAAANGPVSSVNLPFSVDGITRVISDHGVQPFPRDVYSTVVTFAGPDGTLTGNNTGYRNVAGLHNFDPTLANPTAGFDTTGYDEFITVFTEGTGKFAGAKGVIFGWEQGLYEPGSLDPLVVTYWQGYLSVPVPEPETYALMAVGLTLVAGLSYRRRVG
jgi:PEP-CTERM motif